MADDTLTGYAALDKILVGGLNTANKYFDMVTASSNAKATSAMQAIEQTRLDQLGILAKTTTVGGVSFPNWAIPAALGALGFVWYLKKK